MRIEYSDEPTEESIAFAKYCRELFEYREDGNLYRLKAVQGPYGAAGLLVGSKTKESGLVTTVKGFRYSIAQLVFLIHNNYIPKTNIRYMDKNPLNTKIDNLITGVPFALPDSTKYILEREGIYSIKIQYLTGFPSFTDLEEAKAYRNAVLADIDNYKNYLAGDRELKYIYKAGRYGYLVRKGLGKSKYFTDLEEAKKTRDFLVNNNWDFSALPEKPEKEKKPADINRYIVQRDDGKFYIIRQGKVYYKHPAHTLEIAQKRVKTLIENNWQQSKKPKKENPNKYVYPDGNAFIIEKSIGGKKYRFGRYTTLEEALAARDKLIENNWNQTNEI